MNYYNTIILCRTSTKKNILETGRQRLFQDVDIERGL